MVGTFSGEKSLKALSNKVFRFIQQTLNSKLKILKILSCKYRNCPLRYSLIVNLLSAIYNCDLGIGIATS